MSPSIQTVALLSSNAALSSILEAALAATPRLRVRHFDSETALAAYARIARVDLVVADLDSSAFDVTAVDARLQALQGPNNVQAQVVGLTRKVAAFAGVDEVIAKPMSPRYLLERVLARLERRKTPRAPRIPYGSNVVPLFGPRPVTQS